MNQPTVLLSHPTGNENVRNALRGLAEAGMLTEFWTTIAWNQESGWNRFLPRKMQALLARRSFAAVPREAIRCVPWREMVRLSGGLFLLRNLLCSGERRFSIIGVFRHFDGKVSRRLAALHPDAVFAYEGGARETFREARRLGIATLYELSSTYWYREHKLLSEEAERNREFAGLLPKLLDSQQHMEWKDEELRLADCVFVASQHVRRSIAGVVPDERIRVIPYGAPAPRPQRQTGRDPGRLLRVLFVGSLNQGKGISYLLDAVDRLGTRVDFTMVGRRFRTNARVDDACRRWRWFESIPNSQVLDLMMESDVLVLPSLCDAFGLVVTEALSCGLPVIVTPQVGAGDLVRDGESGFVVPPCSAEAIADRLDALDRDREMLAAMRLKAQAAAAARSWENYRADFAEAVRAAACE
jgi:alpha-maltose-1-phosphate synthase